MLIFTTSYQSRVFQAYDVSMMFPDGTTADASDIRPVCGGFSDGSFVLTFSGLAQIGSKQTDVFVADLLRDLQERDFLKALQLLTVNLTKRFAQLPFSPSIKRLTLFIAGCRQRTEPFFGTISNQENQAGRVQEVAAKQFRLGLYPPLESGKSGWFHLSGAPKDS